MGQYNWCFENSINFTKKYQETEGNIEHKYVPWRTNNALSNYMDTIMLVNEINMHPALDSKLQYDFLFYSVKPKKRFFKKKKSKKDENLELIQQYYKYNLERAKEALSILNKQQLEMIRKKIEKGGE